MDKIILKENVYYYRLQDLCEFLNLDNVRYEYSKIKPQNKIIEVEDNKNIMYISEVQTYILVVSTSISDLEKIVSEFTKKKLDSNIKTASITKQLSSEYSIAISERQKHIDNLIVILDS